MRFMRIKSAEQQGQLMQRRTRDVLIRQRTQIINALRDASGRARVGGGAGQRRGQRIARARDGRSWKKPRRVVAKVEWHPGELYPRVGFIVTNLSRLAERVVALYNKRGTLRAMDQARQGSDQVDAAVMPLVRRQRCASSASGADLQSRQLHADAGAARADKAVVADQPAEKLVKSDAKVVRHGRYVIFQMAEVAVPKELFHEIRFCG